MRIALITTTFLEPTHHAIRQILGAVPNHRFYVFAKRIGPPSMIRIPTVDRISYFHRGCFSPGDLIDVDLVHLLYDGGTSFVAAEVALEAGRPYVLSFHGGFDTNAKIHDLRYRDRTLNIVSKAALTTVTSQLDLARLQAVGAPGVVRVLPVPVDLKGLPKWAGRTTPPLEALCVGRLIPKKGFDLAISALLGCPEVHLTIIGEGPEEKRLTSLAMALGVSDRVRFVGTLSYPDTIRALQRASCLVHPARVAPDGNAEGTPQVILLAQAIGTPVIGTRSGAIAEIVNDHENGLLVPPDDLIALQVALKELAHSAQLAHRLSRNASGPVRFSRTLPNVAQQLDSCYRAAFATTRAPAVPPTYGAMKVMDLAKSHGVPAWAGIVGRGGQGTVWCVQMRDGPPLAIKVHPRFPAELPAGEYSPLVKEGAALQVATPPWFPRLVEYDPKGTYLVREMIIGDDLAQMSRFLLPAARGSFVRLTIRFANAAFRVFHQWRGGAYLLKDLKPANLIVHRTDPGRLVFCDLGSITPVHELKLRRLSQARLGTGKWKHWPPELLLGMSELCDIAIDYFSLGCTLFFLMTGQSPYSNASPDSWDTKRTSSSEYESALAQLATTGADLGADIKRFIATCLNPNPTHRIEARHLWPKDDGRPINTQGAYYVR